MFWLCQCPAQAEDIKAQKQNESGLHQKYLLKLIAGVSIITQKNQISKQHALKFPRILFAACVAHHQLNKVIPIHHPHSQALSFTHQFKTPNRSLSEIFYSIAIRVAEAMVRAGLEFLIK